MAYNSFINKQVGTQSPKFEFKKDRANAAIVSGDGLGEFNFRAFDGTSYIDTSRIISTSSGTIAANRIGSNLEFYTHPDSAIASTQRMVINSEGNVTINAPVSGTALNINGIASGIAAQINNVGTSLDFSSTGQRITADMSNATHVNRLSFQSNVLNGATSPFILPNGTSQTASIVASNNSTPTNSAFAQLQVDSISAKVISGILGTGTLLPLELRVGNFDTAVSISTNRNVTINAPVSGTALTIVAGGETITAGDLTITSGNVYLPNTTSTPIGVVFQGGNRFIHSFGASGCTYIGQNAGSIAVTNTSNNTTAVGNSALTSITTGNDNVAVGNSALALVTTSNNNVAMGTRAASYVTGDNNTAIGFDALRGFAPGSASGIRNTAVGSVAGISNNTGSENVYIGFYAGLTTTGGSENVVVGSQAFVNANASQNVVIGYQAGFASTGFTACTVVGKFALNNTNTGLYNLMLGYGSGTNFTGAESSNICLHSDGVLADSNTLRIGQSTGAGNRQLNRAFICGIDGVNVGSVAKVLTMASDQLGTATITAGAGISVTPGANTITIATTNGIAWTEVTGTSQAMAVDNGYIASNAGLVTLTLPATAVVGDRIRIAGKGAGGWRCGQNAGQTINFGNTATTAGVAGYIDSTNQYDALELLCITANTTWVALSSVGNLNVV